MLYLVVMFGRVCDANALQWKIGDLYLSLVMITIRANGTTARVQWIPAMLLGSVTKRSNKRDTKSFSQIIILVGRLHGACLC